MNVLMGTGVTGVRSTGFDWRKLFAGVNGTGFGLKGCIGTLGTIGLSGAIGVTDLITGGVQGLMVGIGPKFTRGNAG